MKAAAREGIAYKKSTISVVYAPAEGPATVSMRTFARQPKAALRRPTAEAVLRLERLAISLNRGIPVWADL